MTPGSHGCSAMCDAAVSRQRRRAALNVACHHGKISCTPYCACICSDACSNPFKPGDKDQDEVEEEAEANVEDDDETEHRTREFGVDVSHVIVS